MRRNFPTMRTISYYTTEGALPQQRVIKSTDLMVLLPLRLGSGFFPTEKARFPVVELSEYRCIIQSIQSVPVCGFRLVDYPAYPSAVRFELIKISKKCMISSRLGDYVMRNGPNKSASSPRATAQCYFVVSYLFFRSRKSREKSQRKS